MTKRRDSGSGSLYRRSADGRWVAALTLPPGPDGKQRRKVVTAKTKPAAQAKLRDMRREFDKAGDLTTMSPTLAAWLRTWIDRKSRTVLKPRTATGYRSNIEKHIVPAIGRYRLDKLTTDHVRRLHLAMESKGLKSTTVLQAHRVLQKALADAEREGKVTRNVARLVDAPRKALGTRGALSADDARRVLLAASHDAGLATRLALSLLAGLRQGEKLGLTRDAIDFDRGVLTVSWQLQRLKFEHGCGAKRGTGWPCGKVRGGNCPDRRLTVPPDQELHQVDGGLWLTRPKSRAGWREVPLSPHLAATLRAYLDQTGPGVAGLVFHRGDGRPIDPKTDADDWHGALEAAGVARVPLHAARHTTATLLHSLGVPDATRVKIMGHSSATVTAGYTHVSDRETAEAIDKVDRLLLGSG